MHRNIAALAVKEYDLIIVGGGIFGLWAALDAAQRGRSVALIERGDFAQAASANHFRMVHGGIRYLQHGDIARARESSRERRSLLRTAPHQVQPLPIVVPAYGRGTQSKEILEAGLKLYDLIAFDRNRGIQDPDRAIPSGRVFSRSESLALFPELECPDLSGAAVFYDGQVYNPARLALSILKSAVRSGAEAANYVAAERFLLRGNRVVGVQARDLGPGGAGRADALLSGTFEIRGRVVLNATGPWAAPLLSTGSGLRLDPEPIFSRDSCFIVDRPLVQNYGLSVRGRTKDPDALIPLGNRHLFIVPWQGHTLVGVWHKVYRGSPDEFRVTEEDLQGYLDEINSACPSLGLSPGDVSRWMAGLVLFGDRQKSQVHLSYGKRSQLIDHARTQGIEGLITMIGVRFTTARGVAEKAVDLALRKLGGKPVRSKTETTPVEGGGDFDRFQDLLQEAALNRPPALREEAVPRLSHNYGSAYRQIYDLIAGDTSLGSFLGASQVTRAEAVWAARDEMALTLADVVFRRTDLGTAGHPGTAALVECAAVAGAELGWDRLRSRAELDEVCQALEGFGASEKAGAASFGAGLQPRAIGEAQR